jgi:hypothetical protein
MSSALKEALKRFWGLEAQHSIALKAVGCHALDAAYPPD